MFDLALKHTTDEIDRRLRNPFWGGLILGWLTWNWRVWYLTFFVSEDLVGNKIAEVQRMYEYFGWHALPGILLNWIMIPICISYCAIFLFPVITDQFLKKQKKNKENEDYILRADLKAEEENVKASTKLLEAEKKKFETEIEKLRAEMEVEANKKALLLAEEQIKKTQNFSEGSEKKLWDKEYDILKEKYPNLIKVLSEFIYNKSGLEAYWNQKNGEYIFTIDRDIFKIIDLHELIKYAHKDPNDQNVFTLSEKGKFFLKKDSLGT